MPRRFRIVDEQETQPQGPFQPIQLPTHLNLIVYPRQSTQAQVLNHAMSTEMQTDDLIEIGIRYGWGRERCLVIDDDLGVSGTLGIDERIGLTKVMEQIDQHQSRAVLIVNEDRLFRDETMIQVNVFIKFMREHNAYVLTPYMVYNFAERFHVKMFREKAEYAAAYITDYVRERLAGARHKKALRGLYDGRPVSPGYRVDYERKLPDGSDNPTYKKFVIYEPHAAIVRQLAQAMLDGELTTTELYRYAIENGLIFPEWDTWVDSRTRNRTKIARVQHGWFYETPFGLHSMLTNPVYAGHWMVKGRIVQRDNHPAILPQAVYEALFNRLSYQDETGQPNAQRQLYRHYPAVRKSRGTDEEGMLLGLLHDLGDDYPLPVSYHHLPVERSGQTQMAMYYYCREAAPGPKRARWMMQAETLDQAVSGAFLNRLRRSRVEYDPEVYERQATARMGEVRQMEKLLGAQLTEIQEQIEGNLRAMTLRGLTEDEMGYFLGRKRALEGEKKSVEGKLEALRARQQEALDLSTVFKTLDELLTNWSMLNVRQQRRYLARFIQMVGIKMTTTGLCEVWVYWKHTFDESLEAAEIETFRLRLRRARSTEWTDDRRELLRQVYAEPQVAIMKQFPDCTWGAIRRQIARLGLNRRATLMALGRWPERCPLPAQTSYEDWRMEHPDEDEPSVPPVKQLRKQFWTPEEEEVLRANLHLIRTELMPLLPDRSWGSIKEHMRLLGLDREGALKARGISPNQGYGSACSIPLTMTWNEWLAQQAEKNAPDEAGSSFSPDALVTRLGEV